MFKALFTCSMDEEKAQRIECFMITLKNLNKINVDDDDFTLKTVKLWYEGVAKNQSCILNKNLKNRRIYSFYEIFHLDLKYPIALTPGNISSQRSNVRDYFEYT